MKLNKTTVANLPFSDNQVFYWDDQLPCFGVRVGQASKTFLVQRRIGGKTKRVTIGRFPSMSAEVARDEARKVISKLTLGTDVAEEKRTAKVKGITLKQVFADFLAERQLKPKTVKDYRQVMSKAYGDWQDRPVNTITKDMIANRHKQLGTNNGQAYANLAARTLRSIMNFAAAKYEVNGKPIVDQNPVARISQTRSWFKVSRRTNHIKPHQLKPWFDAVSALENKTIKDYLLFVLLTGCRKSEAEKLRWSDVDFNDRSFVIRDPKNSRPIALPLSDYLFDLLQNRAGNHSEFVFEGDGKTGHLVEPKRAVALVCDKSGVAFNIHDLRRTFITISESLDISRYSLKALVNHADSSDVTAGYVQMSADRLRQPMQQITNKIFFYIDNNPKNG